MIRMAVVFMSMLLTSAVSAQKQGLADPTHWSYEAKKLSVDEYEVTFKLTLDEGWHIWSLTPGGDGYQIVPSFTFDKGVTPKGKVIEKGHANTVLMQGMDSKVTYLSGAVAYSQVVKVKDAMKLTGEHEYQICNDVMCLPPKTVKFEVLLNRH